MNGVKSVKKYYMFNDAKKHSNDMDGMKGFIIDHHTEA